MLRMMRSCETLTRGRHGVPGRGRVACTLFAAQDDSRAEPLTSARAFRSSRRSIDGAGSWSGSQSITPGGAALTLPLDDCREEPVAGMNAGKGAQVRSIQQASDIVQRELARCLQAL